MGCGYRDANKRASLLDVRRLYVVTSLRVASHGSLEHGNILVILPWWVECFSGSRRVTHGAYTSECGNGGGFNVARRLVVALAEGRVHDVTISFKHVSADLLSVGFIDWSVSVILLDPDSVGLIIEFIILLCCVETDAFGRAFIKVLRAAASHQFTGDSKALAACDLGNILDIDYTPVFKDIF